MTTTDMIDRAAWERLAREAPHRFEDEALDQMGLEPRDDEATAILLDIVTEMLDVAGPDPQADYTGTYDVFLSYWQPLRLLRESLDSEWATSHHGTIKALVKVVLDFQDRIAALEARSAES